MVVSTDTFLADTIIFLRNLLRSNITDPLSGQRSNGVGFVMTAFPKRDTQYPVVTVKSVGMDTRKLGMQSEATWTRMRFEVQIFSRSSKECDTITQQVINTLRSNQYGTGSTDAEEIHGFQLQNMTSVVDESEGDNIIHKKIMQYEYKVILS